MEIAWDDVVGFEFDRQGYLHLNLTDGFTVSIYVSWYSPAELDQLEAYCRDRMLAPGRNSTPRF